jgi:putative peptide zinc metalloprotease protein
MSASFFNDSWYKVSELRVSLLASVVVQEQIFRTKKWIVLKDSSNEAFFRVSMETFQFLQALTPERTVQEIWETYVDQFPKQAPSREEVVALITQLHASNLLYFRNDANAKEISRRVEASRRSEWVQRLTSILYFRLPLWNPDAFLTWLNARIPKWLVWAFLCAWAVAMVLGGIVVVEHVDTISDRTQGILSVGNIGWLYLCTVGMKLVHEMFHGLACKRYGGRVRGFGLMFLIFTPLPYVDVTSSWGFPSQWHRMMVGVAGMFVELFIAAVSAVIWANTGAGLLNGICFNLMFVGSVSSIVFNGNPLLRFDAYYILSDWVGIPNLYAKAQAHWLHFGKKYVFGLTEQQTEYEDPHAQAILYTYGLLSYVYLLMVTWFVTSMLLDQWFIIGIVALVSAVFAKLVQPVWSLLRFAGSAQVRFNKRRALAITYGVPALVLAIVFLVPVPCSLSVPGVLESQQFEVTHADTDGRLVRIVKTSGERVRRDDVIAVLENKDLDSRIRINRDEYDANQMALHTMLYQSQPDLESVRLRTRALDNEFRDLNQRRAALTVKADFDGWWESPALHQNLGGWVYRGEVLGDLVDTRSFRFSGVISQEQAQEIFASRIQGGDVAMIGQSEHRVALSDISVIPYESTRLTSAALGWLGGGDVPVRTDEASGTQTREPFFLLRGNLPEQLPAGMVPMHGLSGKMKVFLRPQTIWAQASMALRQLVQKRYSVS